VHFSIVQNPLFACLILEWSRQRLMRRSLLFAEAAVMERTDEGMQRYAIEHDALRRQPISSQLYGEQTQSRN